MILNVSDLNTKEYLSKSIKDRVIRYSALNSKEFYLCSCGHLNSFEAPAEENQENEEIKISSENKDSSIESYSDLELMSILIQNDRVCSKCNKDFKIEAINSKIINTGEKISSVFEFNQEEDFISISILNFYPIFSELKGEFELKTNFKKIEINKQTKDIFYYENDNEKEIIELDEVVKYVKRFFDGNSNRIYGIINLHVFINNLSWFVSDSSSINIFNELLSSVANKALNINVEDVFKRIFIIFFSIIRYSNLSTIGILKGPNFLYDMIVECDLPKPNVLIENQITSPIKIFNFLVKNYIKKLSGELNSNNKSVVEFKFKSKSKKYEFSFDKDYEFKNLINTKGEIQINEINGDGAISKIVFKKIEKFSDYKSLINYLRFISYKDLVFLIQNYEIEFLTNFINLIFHRNNTNFDKIKKLIPIIISYCKQKEYDVIANYDESYINYSSMNNFSFIEYDDSIKMLMMLKETIEEDDERGKHVIKKALKEFSKINTYKKLIEFHDELNVYYKGVADPKKNSKFREFASQFRFLESYDDKYNGPLEIQIIATPDGVIKEGWEMKHSAPAYIDAVVERRYLMCKVFDRSQDVGKDEITRFTLGLDYNQRTGLTFDQVKGFANQIGSNRFKKLVMEYLEAKDISYQPIKDLKIEL